MQKLCIYFCHILKGLGKKLMLLSEEYFKEYKNQEIKKNSSKITNFDYLYLTTKDQQAFYETLGYESIQPILCYTVKEESKNSHIMKNLFKNMSNTNNASPIQTSSIQNSIESLASSQAATPPPPPPPPPLPLLSPITNLPKESNDKQKIFSSSKNQIFWYKKLIKHDN